MHVTWGAYEVNFFASLASLAFALLWLLGWWRVRCAYMLTLACGWCGLCVYWGLIAISAGPAPVFDRGDIAAVVRSVLVVSVLLLGAGKLAALRLAWRYTGWRGDVHGDGGKETP